MYKASLILVLVLFFVSGLYAGKSDLKRSADFGVTLNVADKNNNQQDLVFGTAPDATSGFDSQYDEVAPPFPGSGRFDARFRVNDNPGLPLSLISDFRASMGKGEQIRWNVTYQPEESKFGNSIIISWNRNSLPERGHFFLVTGNSTTSYINMRTQADFFDEKSSGQATILYISDMQKTANEVVAALKNEENNMDFAITLAVEDKSGNQQNLVFGTAIDATSGFDSQYDEVASPFPGPDRFDARFQANDSPGLPLSLVRDFRASMGKGERANWNVAYQAARSRGSESSVGFSWNRNDLPAKGHFILVVGSGAASYINMRTQSNFIDKNSSGQATILYISDAQKTANEVVEILKSASGSVNLGTAIRVADKAGNWLDLVFGTAPDATSGFDPKYDQLAPRMPEPGNFDARFQMDDNPAQLLSFIKDFRALTGKESTITWKVRFQAAKSKGKNPITFSWQSEDLPTTGKWLLSNGENSEVIDMRMQKSYTDYRFQGELRIIYLPKALKNEKELSLGSNSNSVDLLANTQLPLNKLNGIPNEFTVEQNYPNPFNPTTEIRYNIPSAGKVDVAIFNALGQKVRTLISQTQEAGLHSVVWDATSDFGQRVPSGLYFYSVTAAGKYKEIKRMVLLK